MAACVLLLPSAAAAAPNLIGNPGFETAGTSATMFSDTLPDLGAWQITAGNLTLAAGALTSQGTGSGTDIAVVRNSQDYQDGVLTLTATPLVVAAQETGGAVVRYRDSSKFYMCGLTKCALVVKRRLAGTDSVIATASYTPAANSAYALTATASGTTISCKAVGPGGVTATATATDSSFATGMIGVAAINTNTAQQRQMRFTQPVTMTAVAPQSWSGIGVLSGRPGMVADRIAPANSGSAYLQLFGGAGTFSGYSQQASIAVLGGSSYTLSAAIRTDSVSGAAKVLAIEPDGTTTTLASVTGTTGWTVYSTNFTTKPATTTLTVRLRLDGSGRASFDDLGLSATPSVGLSLSAGSVDFGGVDPISSPFVLSPALSATVTSNTNWSLSFQGGGDFADGTGKSYPLARLGWRLTGSGGAYTAVSTTTQAITSGVANSPAGTVTPIDFQLQVTYADPVSSQPFQTTLTYIATTP
ncbi:MAG: Carbohydrate binding domain [Gaiellales bacterium]|nr:Carbohydrate binding domain [Gaiellales bacterium]